MGRDPWSKRKTVEKCKSIDTRFLRRHGCFSGFRSGTVEWRSWGGTDSIGIQVLVDLKGGYLRLSYTQNFTGEKTELDYVVELVATPCNFGGVRYWFICPLTVKGKPCGKRVGTLFLPPGGQYFGCRHCHNLTYRCQKEHDKRMDSLRKDPELLWALIKSGDSKDSLLALNACEEVLRKMDKRV